MENQLQFLDAEIKVANDRMAMLQTIRDILTDKVAAELASLQPLQEAKETAEARIEVLEGEKEGLQTQNNDLTSEVQLFEDALNKPKVDATNSEQITL